jgi:hypothetical protein
VVFDDLQERPQQVGVAAPEVFIFVVLKWRVLTFRVKTLMCDLHCCSWQWICWRYCF